MNRFSTRFKRHSAPLLLREYGESIEYLALGESEWRTIELAAVLREGPELLAETGDLNVSAMIIRVLNDATGIASDDIDTGGDLVRLPLRLGESVKEFSLNKNLKFSYNQKLSKQ